MVIATSAIRQPASKRVGLWKGRTVLRPFPLAVSLTALLHLATPSIAAGPEVRFTVADSIAMTRIVDPSPARSFPTHETFKFSPGGKYFVIVSSQGQLESDTVKYEIRLYDVNEALTFLNKSDRGQPPEPRILASFESTPYGTGARRPGGISGARWMPDSRTIAFVGERLNSPSQVYTVDIFTGELRQLTSHPSHVRQFDISAQGQKLVYSARNDPPDWEHRNRHGYAVESAMFRDLTLLQPDKTSFNEDAYYIIDTAIKKPIKLDSGQHTLTRRIWLSGSGRWAIGLAYANDIPAAWLAEYESWKDIGIGQAKQQYEGNSAFRSSRGQVTRYVLVDTETGAIDAVLQSPGAAGAKEVHWTSDGQRAIIVNTHLPLDGVDEQELDRRRQSAAIVEFDVATRGVTPIDSFPASFGGDRIVGAQLLDDTTLLVQHQLINGPLLSTTYRREADRWVELKEKEASSFTRRLSLTIKQDMNTPPDILAVDNNTGKQRLITALNPQIRLLPLGQMEIFEWTDENGRRWRGGLLFPTDYDGKSRYPLVIQTYGFSPDEFVVDGPSGITSAFAARPLADQGMIVLQMDRQPIENRFKFVTPSEGPNYVAAYEAAVHALHLRGIVDRTRVGIIGWSRTGMHVSYAVAFSELRFAAATIADSTAAGLLDYVWSYGQSFPGMLSKERLLGAPFWGADRQTWLERSPTLNAHRIRTPLRIEAYGTDLNPYWGMFATMKLRSRPVEMIHIPLASHLLQRPQARYTSQQGNVDWFAFWLQGYEDQDPSKVEQYERWRKLRQQHEEVASSEASGYDETSQSH